MGVTRLATCLEELLEACGDAETAGFMRRVTAVRDRSGPALAAAG